jgi:hypothetical protein
MIGQLAFPSIPRTQRPCSMHLRTEIDSWTLHYQPSVACPHQRYIMCPNRTSKRSEPEKTCVNVCFLDLPGRPIWRHVGPSRRVRRVPIADHPDDHTTVRAVDRNSLEMQNRRTLPIGCEFRTIRSTIELRQMN